MTRFIDCWNTRHRGRLCFDANPWVEVVKMKAGAGRGERNGK